MQHVDLILDETSLRLLDRLAEQYYGGSRYLAVQAAIESLAAHVRQGGWELVGFEPVRSAGGSPGPDAAPRFRPIFAPGRNAAIAPPGPPGRRPPRPSAAR
jgi:hypothetical protein